MYVEISVGFVLWVLHLIFKSIKFGNLFSGQNNARTHLRCRSKGGVLKFELAQALPFSTVTSYHSGCFQRQKTACDFKATFSLPNVLILLVFSFQVTRIWRCAAPKTGEFSCMIHALLRSVVLSVFTLSHSEPTDFFFRTLLNFLEVVTVSDSCGDGDVQKRRPEASLRIPSALAGYLELGFSRLEPKQSEYLDFFYFIEDHALNLQNRQDTRKLWRTL